MVQFLLGKAFSLRPRSSAALFHKSSGCGTSFQALGVGEFFVCHFDLVRDPVPNALDAGGLICVARLHKVARVRHDLVGIAEEAFQAFDFRYSHGGFRPYGLTELTPEV
jgi:hypothetical protein